MSRVATDRQGFLKFVSRASNELAAWFGAHCNHDPTRMAFLASREWDGMDDLERKFFIKAQRLDSREQDVRSPSGSNSFICYLLHKRYNHLPDTIASKGPISQAFNPKFAKVHGENWRQMPKSEQEKYSTIKLSDLGISHVLEARRKLHEIYDPKKLTLLEFINRTKPKLPIGPRMWFHRKESLSIKSDKSHDKWANLDQTTKDAYEVCAILDKRRYNFEKSAWITKLLTIDFDSDNFTLSDFEIPGVRSRQESLDSIMELSKDLQPSLLGLKRTRGPFSLFIEAYRYKIRDERPEFQFGAHLKECSEAWAKLTEEEKQAYKEASKKLREDRKKLLDENKSTSIQNLPISYFNTSKSVHGPCRPSHLIPRLPTTMSLWAQEMKIPMKERRALWAELPDEEKQKYAGKREQIKLSIEEKRKEVNQKLDYIKELIEEAKLLEEHKKKLKLIGPSKRSARNLYT